MKMIWRIQSYFVIHRCGISKVPVLADIAALPFEKVILVNSILASKTGRLNGESTPSPNIAKLKYQSSREIVSLPVYSDFKEKELAASLFIHNHKGMFTLPFEI